MTARRKVGTVDLTPTWRAVLPVFIMALEQGTDKGRAAAVAELERMARMADDYTGHHTETPRQAAERGLRLLIRAREAFKAARNERTLERCKAAISSARGAVRIQDGRESRAARLASCDCGADVDTDARSSCDECGGLADA